jgi:PAS domain S-box-containing protein
MTSRDDRPVDAAGLRLRAEETARVRAASSPENVEALSPEETRRTLHELRVHQIELEMQNEELRRAQVELDAARERYFDLYDLAPVGYCTVSEQGLILEANLTAAGLLGEARAALVKQPISRFILPGDMDIHYLHFKRLLETGSPQAWELRLLRKDSAPFWARVEATAVQDADGTPVSRVVMTDITERKRSEQAMVRASERHRVALEAALLGAWEYRFDTGEVSCDDCCRHMFGLPVGGQIEYNQAMACIHAKDRAGVGEAVRQAIAGVADGADHREFRVVWPDGSVHWVAAHGRVYFESEGDSRRAVRYIGVSMDTTERRRAEENLRQAQKLESLGLLAGGIAHDFNNLLVGVIGNASLAEGILPPESPVVEILRCVIDAGEKAAHLTRQMLAYAGKGRFVLTPVSLPDLVRENVALVRSSVSKNIAFRVHASSDTPAVESDPGQMQQVIMNLILNAAESLGGNPGTVSITTAAVTLEKARIREGLDGWAVEPGRYAFLEVVDTGCGMDAATRERIFDPFFTTKFQGRGLGLAAVAGIVRTHRGGIELTTTPGAGSTFRVLLPAMASPVAPSAPTVSDDLRGQGTVLFVDDEQAVRNFAQLALKQHGYDVLLAGSGQAAIDAIGSDGDLIRLVVLDLTMLGMNGEQTLSHLRELRPELDVIISSGYVEAEVLPLFKDSRIAGFLQKPYTAQQLARKVKTVIHAKKSIGPNLSSVAHGQ